MSLFKKRSAKATAKASQSGERRQLTVLFYDIVGSTALQGAHDPETLRAALDLIHTTAAEVLEAHGGSLEQVMGDGGMAYFGYPHAQEDAAYAAVEAGLELLSAREEIAGAPDLRIGIATSVVVLPDTPDALASGRLGAVGVAPNLAARLEAATAPNTVMVSPATYALTARAVVYSAVDGLTLKGFADVKRAWQATEVREIDSRHARDRDGNAPLTGRQTERTALQDAWTRTVAGHGTALLIEGEPGIGKSRLLAQMLQEADGARHMLLQCQPRTEGEALFSLIQMYDRAYERGTDPALSDAAVRTAEQLGALEDDDSLSPDARRAAIVSAVRDEVMALCREKPLILLAEDLHWADEVTLAVIEHLALQASSVPLLLLATTRPEAALDDLRAVLRPLPLEPLDDAAAAALIEAAAPEPLSEAARDWILARGDGNPLFLLELTAHACDHDDISPTDRLKSADVFTLRDLLSARLQQAGQAKRTAQVASVLGREYPYHVLLRLMAAQPRDVIDADLQRLVDHGLKEALGNGYAYAFRHALVRDVAYDSQLWSVREALHGQIVDLVDADPALAEDVPDILLAEHCLAAERTARGVTLLVDVAEEAIRRSALRAPRASLERAHTLIPKIPAGRSRDLLLLRLLQLLGPLVTLLDGPRAAAPLYNRAQKLYFDLSESDRQDFFPVLWGWWFTASDLKEQTRRSEILIRDVTPDQDAESRLQALHCGWATLFDGGAHSRCLQAITDGLALYDEEKGARSRVLYGHDARVCGLGERALSGWLTGRLDMSAEAIHACTQWADHTGHGPSQLHGLDIAMQVAFFNGDVARIDQILTRIAAISAAEAAPAIAAKRQIFQVWKAVRAGAADHASSVLQGLSTLRDMGVLEDTPIYADIAAEVTAVTRGADAALGALNEEIAEARDTGLTFWLPELLRRKAMLAPTEADAALSEGWEVAQAQDAQMLVLRTLATRLDLGLDLPSDVGPALAVRLPEITDSPLRRKVVDALGL